MSEKPSKEHVEKYEALAQALGIEALRELIPASPFEVLEAERIGWALNAIPLHKWDAQQDAVIALARAAGMESWSLAMSVCVLKHVARFHYREYQRHPRTGKVHVITRGIGGFAVSACGVTNLDRMTPGEEVDDLCAKCKRHEIMFSVTAALEAS
jgi:hypothetical protein